MVSCLVAAPMRTAATIGMILLLESIRESAVAGVRMNLG